jgi:rod shape-determining protein MreD
VIITAQTSVRLALLGLLTVLLQLAFFSKLSFIGTTPDVTPVVVMSLGVLGGSLAGAVAGFGVGLFLDALMLQTMGASSLVLIGVGYVAGRYREITDSASPLAAMLLAGGLTLAGGAAFALLQVLLVVGAPVSPLLARDIVVKAVLNLLLAYPIHRGLRFLVRRALIEPAPRPRRVTRPDTSSTASEMA